ncbi:MAG: Rha family transcriptional regulator [Pseudomonadota bacterium]
MNDLSEFVTLNDTTLTTDSRRVAKHFNKRHDNVLQAYDRLDCSPVFNHLNFQAVNEMDEKGQSRRVIRMTKDGFVFLAMGFRGVKAASIKERYINAFNSMADQLQKIGMSLWNQRLELEKTDATSFMWASFGSKRMLERRKVLPEIRETRERLQSEMEPTLFGRSELAH